MPNDLLKDQGAGVGSILSAIAEKLGIAKEVSIGFMEGATYEDGTPVAAVAYWNEYGTSTIQPRPFFRGMVAKKSPQWGSDLATVLREKDNDAAKALGIMGERIKDQLTESINEFTTPALSPRTIEQKGFDKPLIDTGHMRDSITSKVE